MSDNTQQPGGGAAPRDPWAPPDSRVELGKQAEARPPAVHDQPTVTSMPSAEPGTGPIPGAVGAFGPPQADVPPPPVAPNGPGGPATPPAGQYGYPAPAPPAVPYGGYPGYPGYGGQPAWGGQAPANGLGTAAMVLGIIAVVGFCLYGVNIILGILALIFGIIGLGRAKRGEATNRGMAIAGIILGSVGVVLGSVILGVIIWAATNAESDEDFGDSYDPYPTSLVVGSTR
ncbi:DUF4190 domain-containing protein [Streptomyces clavifer]|uniref:DUF4190 domain-containing protein n=1 Tax=Streptomyces TaxID=1883 RepID=UPI00099E6434|nr:MULTISPECIES: DUF4190 domain-containing protein [unclassified Streptomyces]RPK82159.1 hypothetical protein EES45_09720 [Streptomyces sp. ADI97-07]